jgi:restriction system protein
MARRRSKSSFLEEVLIAPWPMAARAAVAAAVGAWLVPVLFGANVVLRPLAGGVRTFFEIAAAVFALIAFIKWAATQVKNPSLDAVAPAKGAWRPASVAKRDPTDSAAEDAGRTFDRSPGRDAYERRSEPSIRPTSWSLDLLQSLDWKRFEEVAAAYFREMNFRCVTQAFGPDGGIDATLYFRDLPEPVGVVQCKAWGDVRVGVKAVRELLGVMTHARVKRGYFMATGEFSEDAVRFAAVNSITLISGHDLLTAIARMDEASQARLLAVSTEGDYTTPTCASCGGKMVKKTIRDRVAWSCPDFPRCRSRLIYAKGA